MKSQVVISNGYAAGAVGHEAAATAGAPIAWEQLRLVLREHFGETAFRRWFESVTASVVEEEAGSVVAMNLPTRFMRDWVEAHYGDTIRTLWRQMAKQGRVD